MQASVRLWVTVLLQRWDGRCGQQQRREIWRFSQKSVSDRKKHKILAAMSFTVIETLIAGLRLPWVSLGNRRRHASNGSLNSTMRQPSEGYITVQKEHIGPSILQELLDQTLAHPKVDPALKTGLAKVPAADRARCLRAYLVQTKTDSYNGCHRLHFDPLYDDAADSPDSVAALKIQQFAAQNPDTVIKVMFFISRFCAPGPPKRVVYENLDDVIHQLFVQNLKSCWDILAAAVPSSAPAVPLPPADCRELVLQRMSVALRDSVLNDLICSGDHLSCRVLAEDVQKHKTEEGAQQHLKANICSVLKSLLHNGGSAHRFEEGPLRSLVVLKSDTFSHFSHCDENCATVNACIPVHFHWPKQILPNDMLELARHIYDEESQEMLLYKAVLESQFIKDFVENLKSKGFDVEVVILNANSTFCTGKLIFPVSRSLHDAGCMLTHVAALKSAIAQVLQSQSVAEKEFEVDDTQVCLAKGLHCPTCGFCSDSHSMFRFRRWSEAADLLEKYTVIFESASGTLPELEFADEPVCRGFDRGPEDINWLQRITRSEQAKGQRMKERQAVQLHTLLRDVHIGDVLLSSRVESFSTDMGANLKRYASPAPDKSKATVFMIERPHANSRFVDPVSIIPFLSPSFRECEVHIEKDAELQLMEIRAGTRGTVTGRDGAECCDTYVFSLVSNINALSPSGIANLKLPGVRMKTAEKLHRGLHSAVQKCRNLEEFMEEIDDSCVGMRKTHKDELKQKVQAGISEGRLSFGCEIIPDPSFVSPQKPKPTEAVSPPAPATPTEAVSSSSPTPATPTEAVPPPTPATEPRRKPAKSAQGRHEAHCGAELPEDYSLPTLFPLLKNQFSDASDSREWFWCGSDSGKSRWGGGLLPRGTCPLQEHHPERYLVYTFKQLLCAQYYDGHRHQCICEDALSPSQQSQSLLEEAEAIDNFMNELRRPVRDESLTRQDLENAFEFSDSISKTQTVGSVLVIRADFLELCREVIGLRLPALACQEEACGCQVRARPLSSSAVFNITLTVVAGTRCQRIDGREKSIDA